MLENHKKICSTGSTRKNLVFSVFWPQKMSWFRRYVTLKKYVTLTQVCDTYKGFLTFLSNYQTGKGMSHLYRFVTHRTDCQIVTLGKVCYTKKGLSHLECFVKLSHLERFVTHRTDFHIVTIGKVCHAKKGLSHLKGCVGCVTLRKVCQTKTDMSH